MNPIIIPEPEEREAHRQGATARPRGNHGFSPRPVSVGGWLARLAIPMILLSLMVVQYSIHSRENQSLKARIEALQAHISAPQTSTALVSGDTGRLADQVAQHDELIRTLEQRLATQIVELDRLRTAAAGTARPQDDDSNRDELYQSLALLDALKELPARHDVLVQRVAHTEQRLDQATVQPPVAPTDETQLKAITVRLDDAMARLGNQETVLKSWREDVETRLAASANQAATAAPEARIDPLEIAHIRRTLALLKQQHPFVKFPPE